MTSFIIPSFLLAALFIWAQPWRSIKQDTAVFWYKVRYRWRHLLSMVQPVGIELLEDGILILDTSYRVVDMNAMAEKLLGQSAVGLIGRSITIACPGLRGKFEQATASKIEIVHDNQAAVHTYEVHLKSLSNWQNKPQGCLLLIKDITEIKNREETRRDMIQTLVHDLRAPLSNSMFALQMLEAQLNGQATSEVSHMIEITISNTERILERINKILDVERLESQRMPLAISAVSLPDVLQNVRETLASKIMSKDLEIRYDIPDSLSIVWADASLLERILQNLVDNGIRFTPEGGEIVIEATAVSPSSPPTVHISISDTGTGIPEQMWEKIFDKFTGESDKGGSGLGLAFCKMALAAHGQDIWVKSKLGQGATFTFSLALAAPPKSHLPEKLWLNNKA